MTVLCTDKTGTITAGAVQLDRAVDPSGRPSEEVLRLARLNAGLQHSFPNPLDQAILAGAAPVEAGARLDELPYDFQRKRLSVLVDDHGSPLLVTKGAFDKVLEVCITAEVDGRTVALEQVRAGLERSLATLSADGYRVLALASRPLDRTFANTLKYIRVTTSANFGNVLSMAVAAGFLPYLPLLPRQILLLNFLSDIPGVTIAGDRVDPEQVQRPRAWDLRSIRTFMVVFGLLSSVFDILTFAVLRLGFGAGATLFRSGWFIESTVTELAVMLVLRTNRPFYRSRPGRGLLWSSVAIAAVTLALPYSPLAGPLGLTAVPAGVLDVLVGLTALYVIANEAAKRRYPPAGSAPGT
jgi:magnesium-transporting ATPase (P-type)